MDKRALSVSPSVIEGLLPRRRRPMDELTRELAITAEGISTINRIIGDDTIDSIAILDRAIKASKSVALLITGKGSATAFLISPNQVLTNNHALVGKRNDRPATVDDLRGVTVTFNFQQDAEGLWNDSEEVTPVLDGSLLRSDHNLDYAVFSVAGDPGSRWGAIDVPAECHIEKGDDVFIVQHPNGGPKQIALSGNVVLEVGETLVGYTTDTVVGSSGSPVFDRSWDLVALHRRNLDARGNEGVRIDRVREAIEDLL